MPKSVIKSSAKKQNPYVVKRKNPMGQGVWEILAGIRKMTIKSPAKKPVSPVKKPVSPVKKPVPSIRKTLGSIKNKKSKKSNIDVLAKKLSKMSVVKKNSLEALIDKLSKSSVRKVKRDDGIDVKNIVSGKRIRKSRV